MMMTGVHLYDKIKNYLKHFLIPFDRWIQSHLDLLKQCEIPACSQVTWIEILQAIDFENCL
jgi:hypothetical protein